MRSRLSILALILTLSLPACETFEFVTEGEQVCPVRIWMSTDAKEWVRFHVAEVHGPPDLPFKIFLSAIGQQQQKLDVCRGLDPNRPAPPLEGTG